MVKGAAAIVADVTWAVARGDNSKGCVAAGDTAKEVEVRNSPTPTNKAAVLHKTKRCLYLLHPQVTTYPDDVPSKL